MMKRSCEVIAALKGKTLVTAESCTGGGIGTALTAVPGSSAVFKGGIISYTNAVKVSQLGVDSNLLKRVGAVSAPVAEMMAVGVRKALDADIAISVTGLAGPDGDSYRNPVGTVFVGYADSLNTFSKEFHFQGNREDIRRQAVIAALDIVLEQT